MVKTAYLALGSNIDGAWGNTDETVLHAIDILRHVVISVNAISRVYKSPSLVSGQPDYANLVLSVDTDMSVAALLRALKQLEKLSGRRTRPRWSARPLDIDIVMAGSVCYNALLGGPSRNQRGNGASILNHRRPSSAPTGDWAAAQSERSKL